MTFSRRMLLLAASASASAALAATPPLAQAQNDKAPIRFLVGFSAGGGTDLLARLMAQHAAGFLGRPVVVENLPGAGGSIAANALHGAVPDGQTYMMANNAVPLFQTLVFRDRNRWEFARDFVPVAGLSSYPLALAVPTTLGVNDVAELVEHLKTHPQQATFGNIGAGGMTHMLGDDLGRKLGIPLTPIPYKGASPMITDLVGGHIPAAIGLMDNMMSFHKAGSVKILAIFSDQRSALIPEIPTFREQGIPVLDGESWQGLWAPAGTPQAEIDRMADALRRVLEKPEIQAEMRNTLAVEPTFRDGRELAALQARELAAWAPVIEASGFKP